MSITNNINKKFLAFFGQHEIKINSKFLVGVSGGSDSMALLDIGLKAGLNISVAHVNYQLRKEESEKESIIVKQYCLENKLNFSIMGDGDSFKDLDRIQETMLDIAKGMRFFPPEKLVNKWIELGMIDETQKREPLPTWALKHTKDLRDVGINEKNDLRFITTEMLESLEPAMTDGDKVKAFKEKAKQGGIMTQEEEALLLKKAKRIVDNLKTKDQVLIQVSKIEPNLNLPKKILKSGPRKGTEIYENFCYDIADAYVIGSAYYKDKNIF